MGDSSKQQKVYEFKVNDNLNEMKNSKLLDFYEEFIIKSIEKKIISNLPSHLLVDSATKALETIHMKDKEANFLLKASEQRFNCENSRYFLFLIALHRDRQRGISITHSILVYLHLKGSNSTANHPKHKY